MIAARIWEKNKKAKKMKMNTKGQQLDINGINLNVLVEGAGDPVLLLHGYPDSIYLWRDVIPELVETEHQVIVPDQRGFGLSDAPEGKEHYAMDKIAADALAILDHLGLSKVQLVGHDFGAIVGWYLALNFPERFHSYIPISVGHPIAYASAGLEQKQKGWYALFFQFEGLAEQAVQANDWALYRMLTGNPVDIDEYISDMSRPGRLTAGMNWYRANLFDILTGKMPTPNASIPVLGIIGKQDIGLTVEQMENSVNYCDAGFRFKSIDGGHWLPVDSPKEVSKLILGFIDNK
jgi:pimeloyl-ACP methyl ester carboxylesterase